MRNKLFQKLVALLVVSALALSMVACGSSDDSDTTTETTTTDSTDSTDSEDTTETTSSGTPTDTEELKAILDGKTISWMTCQGKYYDEYALMADYLYETYGCEVDFQVVPDDEYFTLLKVKLSTGEVTDIFEYNYPLQNQELDVVNNCVDLSDEPWVENLINPDLSDDPDDGNYYALPSSSMGGTLACFYNVDALEACGITDPCPSTYDEWLDILETVKEEGDGITPLYMTLGASWTAQVFMTSGYSIMIDDPATTSEALLTGEIAFTDVPEYEECVSMWVDLIDSGYVNDDYLSVDYDSAFPALANGEAAMYIINQGFAVEIMSQYPDANISAMVIPYDDEEILTISGLTQGLFVTSAGEQIDVTKAFLQAWSTVECQQIFYNSIGGYPAFEGIEGGDVVDSLAYLYETYVVTGRTEIQMNDYLTDVSALQSECCTYYVSAAAGLSTPAEVIADWEALFEDYQQQQGVDGF